MGVKGLKTFIENNDDLLIKNYRLYNTTVIIDTNNLISVLFCHSQRKRLDLFGGDLFQYGQFVNRFFDNLERCNIRPILVFDGAQTYDVNRCKTKEKLTKSFWRFQTVMSINKYGEGSFVLPVIATLVFRSIAVDRELKIIQAIYEADAEVARLSLELKCPVISNDSDFYLFDLPNGVISIDYLQYKHVQKFLKPEDEDTAYYINCCLYTQNNFCSYFPNLEKSNLPLLGALAGNDYTTSGTFKKICARLPLRGIRELSKAHLSAQHMKIMRILYFLCGKTLNELINQLCEHYPQELRKEMRDKIRGSLKVYNIPSTDEYEKVLTNLYRQGFYKTYSTSIEDKSVLESKFKLAFQPALSWLRNAMEKSVLNKRCLELAFRNTIFMRPEIDDPRLPSAHLCQLRCLKVILTLMRSYPFDKRPCTFFDRIDTLYRKSSIHVIEQGDKLGPFDYTLIDIPHLSVEERRNILMATFHNSVDNFAEQIIECCNWLNFENAEEFIMINIIMNYIDLESSGVKGVTLTKNFRKAVLLTLLYFFSSAGNDLILTEKLEEESGQHFENKFKEGIKQSNYLSSPRLTSKHLYNCRITHRITQLQAAILHYNYLNALLGDIMTRIRPENWFNSCLIYNLTENSQNKNVVPLKIPGIILNYL